MPQPELSANDIHAEVRGHMDPALDAFIQLLRGVLPLRFIDLLGEDWRDGFTRRGRNLETGGRLRPAQLGLLNRWERLDEELDFGNLPILFEFLEKSGETLSQTVRSMKISGHLHELRKIRNGHAHFARLAPEDAQKAFRIMEELDGALELGFSDNLQLFQSRFDRMMVSKELMGSGLSAETVVDVSGRIRSMPLPMAFSGMKLTQDQADAVESLTDFLADPNRDVFILSGYAGTGKTFLMKGLVQHLMAERGVASVGLVAPTGRAAKVLTDVVRKGGDSLLIAPKAKTIHRFVYSGTKVVEMARDKEDTETPVLVMQVRRDPLPSNFVCIVDEASMVSDVLTQHENFRFGTGRLLHDLFTRLKVGSLEGAKVIMVGDPGQLPPVDMSEPPALDAAYIRDTYGPDSSGCTLKEVLRQSRNSGVLRLATGLRKALEDDQMHTFPEWGELPSDLVKVKGEWDEAFFANSEIDIQDKVVLVYSNKRAKQLNEEIRRRLFPGKMDVQSGDLLMVVKNNYHAPELMNGELIEVLDASGNVVTRQHRIKTKRKGVTDEHEVHLRFRKVKIRSTVWDAGLYAEKWLLENMLDSDDASLTSEEFKALYVDFKKRHPGLKLNSMAFKEAMNNDPYFNALQVKFGYAITVHKSQGGEWPEVFVDFDRAGGKSNSEYFRWAYTAATRTSQNLNMLTSPFFQGKQMSTGRVETLQKRHIEVPEEYQLNLPFQNSPTANHELVGGAVVWLFAVIGGQVATLRAEQHQVKVSAEWEGQNYEFSLFFKADGKVSSQSYTGAEDKVVLGLNRLVKKSLSWKRDTISGAPMKPIASGRGAFKCVRESLQESLQDRLGPDVQIRLVDSEEYCENVVMTSPEGEECMWKFYFKGNGKSSRNSVHPKSTAGPSWIDFIVTNLND